VLVRLKDVEGPGVATLKRQRIGGQGTLQLPRLGEPVRAVGATPVQLERTLCGMYRSLGVERGGTVDVFVCKPDPAVTTVGVPDAPATELPPAAKR
jgi:hypothetical protein